MKSSFKRTLAVVLSVLMLLSTVMVGAVTTASAATLQAGDKIYLKPSSSWQSDGARFSVFFFTANVGEFWYSMLPSDKGAGIYEAVVPEGNWENLIFVRMNGGNTDNNWDNKWNQTGDLVWDGYNNCYTTRDNEWDGEIGSWSYIDDAPATKPTTKPTTQPTTKPTTKPTTAPTSEATEPTEADENMYLYVSAKSNLSSVGVKTKTTGNLITVTYSLKADQLIDGGQAVITYDEERLNLSTTYNTLENMFPVVKSVAYNLNSAQGEAMFNFSSLKNDFTNGGVLVNLVFERKNNAVGTARVNLNVTDLASQQTTYVEDGVVNSTTGISLSPVIAEKEYTTPTVGTVETDATQNIDVRVSTNLSNSYEVIKVDKANVKVTFKLTAQEAIAFGNGTVTFDESFLALESRFNTRETMFTTVNSGTSYNLAASTGTMKFAFNGIDAQNNKGLFDFSKGGELLTLVFTVRKGASGVAHIRLNVENLGSMNRDYIADYAVVDTVEISATGAALNAVPSATAPTTTPIATGSVPSVPTMPTTQPGTSTDPTESTKPTDPIKPTDPKPTDPKPTETEPAEKAPSVKLNAKKIKAGETTKVVVSNAGGKKVTYKSGNTKVATVNNKGVVTGLAKGKAKIKVTIGGKTVSKTVKVKTDPQVIKGKKALKNNATITVSKGKTVKLNIKGKVSSIKNNVKFAKKGIAKNTANLKKANLAIKGLKKGTVKMTVTINKAKKYTFTVKVK